MKKPRRMLRRILQPYLLVLLPVLLASIIMMGFFRSQWQAEIRQTVEKQLQQLIAEFEMRYVNYQFSMTSLVTESPARRESSPDYERYSLVKSLRSVCHYDPNTDVLFISMHGGEIISSQGSTSQAAFLSGTLGLADESIRRMGLALAQEQSACLYVHKRFGTGNAGYLLVLFPAGGSWSRTDWNHVGYLISTDNLSISRYLSAPELVALHMTFQDGSILQIDLNGSPQALDRIAAGNDPYGHIAGDVSNMGLRLEIVYDWQVVSRVLAASQATGLLLTFLGVALSACLGIFYSRGRVRNVEMLAAQAQGSLPDPPYTGEYIYVGRLMSSLRSEMSTMNLSMNAWQASIRQQTVSLILSGSIQDRATANRMLETCHLEMSDESYCVIKFQLLQEGSGDSLPGATAALPMEICCQAEDEGAAWLILLGELPNTDTSQELRRAYAAGITDTLRRAGIAVGRCGISRAYKELYMANLALREATECLKVQAAGNQPLVCFDDLAGADLGEIRAGIHAFRRCLAAGAESDAQETLHNVLKAIHLGAASEQAQLYWRYRLLDAALTVVCQREDEEKQATYEALLNMDVRNGATFPGELEALLFSAAQDKPDKQQDPWPVIIRYVEKHYANPNLTANEVAQVAGMDKTHLSRLFREHTGETYIEYLSRVRLERAMALLSNTDMPVQEIVEAVGYYDHSSFRRKFKARYGISIQELRQKAGADASERVKEADGE